jgi:hypothetical protein
VAITATPWAKVLIDGKPLGDAQGMREFAVPVGKHRIQLHHPKKSFTRTIDLKSGQRLAVEFNALVK